MDVSTATGGGLLTEFRKWAAAPFAADSDLLGASLTFLLFALIFLAVWAVAQHIEE